MTAARGYRWTWLEQVRARVETGALDDRAGHVALVLAVYYINGSNEAWPSQNTLANDSGLSRRTVQRALTDLENQQLLEIRHGRPAPTRGCVYRLLNASQ
jgi:DNA-binding transcriptional regulator LsrR (DeoR family)